MYRFVDITEAAEGMELPSEAMQINGEYLEERIPGYRTLSVSGREALSPEIDLTIQASGTVRQGNPEDIRSAS